MPQAPAQQRTDSSEVPGFSERSMLPHLGGAAGGWTSDAACPKEKELTESPAPAQQRTVSSEVSGFSERSMLSRYGGAASALTSNAACLAPSGDTIPRTPNRRKPLVVKVHQHLSSCAETRTRSRRKSPGPRNQSPNRGRR